MDGKILDTLAGECPCKNDWCFLKEALSHRKKDDSTLTHMRMMVDFRYIYGTITGKEPNDREALQNYVKLGYVQKFFRIWKEDMTREELAHKMFFDPSAEDTPQESPQESTREYAQKDPTFIAEEVWKPDGINYKLFLEDILNECPCSRKTWCFLKEAVQHTGLSDRFLAQMRTMVDFETLYRRMHNDACTSGEAQMAWADKGYAQKFGNVWQKIKDNPDLQVGLTHEKLFYMMFGERSPPVIRVDTG